MVHNLPNEFEIQGLDEEKQIATNGRVGLTVYPDGKKIVRKRNAIKKAGTPNAYKVQWLFGELNGVRCYIHDNGKFVSIIMTTQDLRP